MKQEGSKYDIVQMKQESAEDGIWTFDQMKGQGQEMTSTCNHMKPNSRLMRVGC